MKHALVAVLAVLACGCRSEETNQPKAGPAPTVVRAPDALLPAIAAHRVRVQKRPLPSYGDADYVEPPSEAELAWTADRAVPFASRIERTSALLDDTKNVMKAYGALDLETPMAGDGPVTLRWSESLTRQFAHLGTILLDELLPTISPTDPTYDTRMGGLAKMGAGIDEMLRGALIVLDLRRAELEARRRLATAWRDHATLFARVIAQPQCNARRDQVGRTAKAERDAAIRDALGAIDKALVRCAGIPQP